MHTYALLSPYQTPPITPPSSLSGHAHTPKELFHLRWPNTRGKAAPSSLPAGLSVLLLLAWAINYNTYLKHMAATPATEWDGIDKGKEQSSIVQSKAKIKCYKRPMNQSRYC